MKTPQTLIRTSVGLIVSGLLATAALAGPGPQYWNRPVAKPAQKSESASKPETSNPAKCSGCKTTPIWGASDRGPAGKGVAGARLVGSRHECARCPGVVSTEKGKANDTMTHNAACKPLLCCK